MKEILKISTTTAGRFRSCQSKAYSLRKFAQEISKAINLDLDTKLVRQLTSETLGLTDGSIIS